MLVLSNPGGITTNTFDSFCIRSFVEGDLQMVHAYSTSEDQDLEMHNFNGISVFRVKK